MVAAKMPPLPPVFLCISLQNPTVVVEVVLILANASFESTTSIVRGASIQKPTVLYNVGLGRLWDAFSASENVRWA